MRRIRQKLAAGEWTHTEILKTVGQGLAVHPIRALTPSAANGLDYLLAIVTYGAEEHPPFKTIEAAALLAALVVLVCADGVPGTG